MVEELEITWKRQLSFLAQPLIVTAVVLIIYVAIFGLTNPFSDLRWLFLAFFALDVIPAFFLHFQYVIKCGGVVVTLNKRNRTIVIEKEGREIVHSFDDINSVEYHSSGVDGNAKYSFAQYRYYKLFFSNGDSINISCLMMDDIRNNLEPMLGITAIRIPTMLPIM